jgi:type IV secretory pathway VirB2 component (pilin)
VQIPEALYQDTKELATPRSALVLPAAIFPLLVVVLPFVTMGAALDVHWGWWVGGFVVALGWAVASGFIARSPKPWASVVRLLGWALLWCIEPFVVMAVLGPIAAVTHVAVVSVIYIGGALAFGYWLWRRYRSKK